MFLKYIFFLKDNFYFINYLIFGIIFGIIIGNSIINIFNFLILLSYIFLILNLDLTKNYKNYLLTLFLLSIIFIFNILFSVNKLHSSITFLAFVGHFILMLSIIFCINNFQNFKIQLSKILFFLIIFVSLDTLIQYFTGSDIFGYTIDAGHGARLSGPFGDEYVVGAFLSKLFFLSILFLVYKKYRYYNIFLILIVLIIIILSNERSASIMFLFASILYLMFNNFFSLKEKTISLLVLLVLIINLFIFSSQLKSHFIERTFEQIGIIETNKKHKNFWDSQWGAHYLTSIEIFKDNPIIGSGADTFRFACSSDEYSQIKSVESNIRCSTHPHNIFIEILSGIGIIGFSIFIFYMIYISKKLLKNFILFKKKSNEQLIYILSFIILFNPIQTTGSFFSTWNGIYYWVLLGFIFANLKELSKN